MATNIKSPASSSLGLPRYVVTFLKHMESHRDYLMWNISENSHKITLRLTWNFRKSHTSFPENIIEKLQRSLGIRQSADNQNTDSTAVIPHDITRLLQHTPKNHERKALKKRWSLAVGAIRRTLSAGSQSATSHQNEFIFRSSSFNLPPHSNSSNQSNNHSSLSKLNRLPRNNSFHTGAFTHSTSTPIKVLPSSPARSQRSAHSWGGSLYHQSLDNELENDTPNTDSNTFLDNVTGSFISPELTPVSPPISHRLRLTYRSEEEIEESLEDLMEKTRHETQVKLDSIRKEWNETVKDWPNIMMTESKVMKPLTLSSIDTREFQQQVSNRETKPYVQSEKQEPIDVKLQKKENNKLHNIRIGECLSSCDKILTRYETEIT